MANTSGSPFEMSIGLEVLNHLGINLYSNTAAVLSEVVANAWDADAKKITVEISADEIIIEDDGCGMTTDDINKRYLYVGYNRREAQPGLTTKFKRKVMGRKGIGKLSLFSIADEIEIQSKADKQNCIGFVMKVPDIVKTIKSRKGSYKPEALPASSLILAHSGTRIRISKFKKGIERTEVALRKKLARRFSAIEKGNNFEIKVNAKTVTIDDRDYFNKLQYIWYYGSESKQYLTAVNNSEVKSELRTDTALKPHKVSGWIGTVKNSGHLKDGTESLNKVSLFVRKKVAQEDMLDEFAEGGLYTKYLIGEIHADFLDDDKLPDIATSNRQEIKKDDARYKKLKAWLETELKYIQSKWTNLRNQEGTAEATKNNAIKSWYDDLKPDTKRKAESMFGKINQLTIEEGQKKELLKQGVLAFEILRYKDNLSALEVLEPEGIAEFTKAFNILDDIESALYYQIITERLRVVTTLFNHLQSNSLEKVIQEHLYNHLWLLDPSWERATEIPSMELTIQKELGKISKTLTKEELKARLDIKYKNPSHKHVIIELKRANVQLDTATIFQQVRKYHNAMSKVLEEVGKAEPIEIIVLLGKKPSDWSTAKTENSGRESLSGSNTRVILYQELIEDAYRNYKEFLGANQEKNRVAKLLQDIDKSKA